MRKRYKIGLIIVSALIFTIGLLALLKLFCKNEEEMPPKNTSNIILDIPSYSYSLDDRDTEYMKNTFEELRNILEEETINEEEYAKTLSKLFIIDFYTLNNKINKYDVGSLEYIYSDKVEEFKNKAMDTLYKEIIDNTYKDRIQELPEISNVEIINIEKTSFELNEETKNAYKVTVNFEYKKDLGYDSEGTIYLLKNNNKLEIIFYEPIIQE